MAVESLDWLRKDVVRRAADAFPQSMAVAEMFSGVRLTYAELDAQIDACAEYLLAQAGGAKGARIALLARNGLHFPLVFYACARAGLIFQPLNWRLTGPELRVLVEDAEPVLLLHTEEFAPVAPQAAAGFSGCRLQHIGETGEAFRAALAAHGPAKQRYEIEDPDGVWTLLYTSGTTGRPKGVIVTPRTGWFSANNFVWINQLNRNCAMLCEVPLFHTGGLFALLHASMFAGMRVWMTEKFNPEDTLRYIDDPEMGVTHMFVVPQIVQVLRDHPNYAATDLSRIKAWCSGGAPLAPSLQMAMLEDGVLLTNGFGMTETGSVSGMPLDADILIAKPGTCGVVGPATDLKLMDTEGNPVPQGEVGEIWIRGPHVTTGYWQRPEANEAAFDGDWFKTGDAAYFDEEGYLYLVDRWKDMFISGGENVYPAEVESCLLEHPRIADAAVIGVDDPKWTEVGAAFIVPREGLTEDSIRAHARERLAGYKRPMHIVFVDSIERTPSGKIKKQELRKLWAERAAEPAKADA